ncbi:NUMOD4 domain-containing protein [Peptoniphilus grossensis]|uniref:NUMOD4 domain-containing protein n=1 Tax=Peptoniphilus grossensis TaxID=1465756 RepID=UPI0002D53D0E|nr:NUMOD4 domain-containing protein [Peptoniphilus grossensis]
MSWNPIKGYEGLYEVSEEGQIRSLDRYQNNHGKPQFIRGKTKSLRKDPQGYLMTDLYKEGKQETVRVHRVVAEAFIKNTFNLPTVNHKDGNKENNKLSNLEWASYKDQSEHLYKNNLKSKKGIEKSIKAMAKATSIKVRCKNNNKVYSSISKAAKEVGASASQLSIACKIISKAAGRDKNGNPLYWEYA